MTQLTSTTIQCDGCSATIERKARIDAGWAEGNSLRDGYHKHFCPVCQSERRADIPLTYRTRKPSPVDRPREKVGAGMSSDWHEQQVRY